MTTGMASRAAAVALVRYSLSGFATEVELAELGETQPLRSTLELDSIDFPTFVERPAAGSNRRSTKTITHACRQSNPLRSSSPKAVSTPPPGIRDG